MHKKNTVMKLAPVFVSLALCGSMAGWATAQTDTAADEEVTLDRVTVTGKVLYTDR